MWFAANRSGVLAADRRDPLLFRVMSFWAGGSHTGMIPSIEPLPADEAAFTALAEQHRRELHLWSAPRGC